MVWHLLSLVYGFFAVIFMQQQKREKVNAGAQDKVIKKLLSRYKTLREHHEETGANAFVIGYAQQDRKGTLLDNPSAWRCASSTRRGKAGRRIYRAWRSLRTGQVLLPVSVELENEVTGAEMQPFSPAPRRSSGGIRTSSWGGRSVI